MEFGTSKSRSDLKFAKSIKVAVAMETATRDATELQGEHKHDTRVNKLTKGKGKPIVTATNT